MKKKTIAITLFPTIYTMIITILSAIAISNNLMIDVKGIMAISLVVLFPLLILIQSMISALNRINIFLSLGTSILSTMLFIMISLYSDNNEVLLSTLYHYAMIYLKSGIFGYIVGKVIYKIKSFKNDEEND